MTRARTPWLLRWGRLCFVLGTVVLVVGILYLAAAVYYATQVSSPGGSSTTVSVGSPTAVELAEQFNLSNPGPFPIQGLTAQAVLRIPNDTAPLLAASSPLTLPGGTTATVRLALTLALTSSRPLASLLVNDSRLPYSVWINATYAGFVGVALATSSGWDWGAPFANLTVEPGTPRALANGTLEVPFSIDFSDHAPFGLNGTFRLALYDAGGSLCGTLAVPVSVAHRAAFAATTSAFVPPGCAAPGEAYSASWTGSGLALPLPGGVLP
jgi:hypothetical protein